MKIVPVFKVRDMHVALKHYTEVLDFKMTDPDDTVDSLVVDLANGEAAFQLTTIEGDYLFGSVANVWVDDVDALFLKYKSRGLDTSGKKNSPVHQGPVDQTWGRREFYVTDADGNTLRFCMPIPD
ncbi:MAG TPA: VOC family protein [Mucilaginibacter sp.]